MSGSDGDWAALASDNERLVQVAAGEPVPADPSPSHHGPAQWAELASQRERLVDLGESFGGLASSRSLTSQMRLAVRVA